mmetsp:Transcript_20950/g.60486  ORF Transcript_20950/g.60486 Transcript_20950/m.60486 type:complete len:207 (+) Transcript_20950:605-1225(+)
MREAVVVHVEDTRQHLPDQGPELALLQYQGLVWMKLRLRHSLGKVRVLPIAHGVLHEVAARTQVHDEIDVPLVLEDRVELHDIGAAQALEDLDLPLVALDVLHGRGRDHLDGHNGARGPLRGPPDLAETALTEALGEVVILLHRPLCVVAHTKVPPEAADVEARRRQGHLRLDRLHRERRHHRPRPHKVQARFLRRPRRRPALRSA